MVTMEEQAYGAATSFDSFVRARGPALWRTAWLLTGDGHLAEDLVQTALSRSWKHWARVTASDGVPGFEAYVRRVLVNTWSAWWRRKWRGEVPSSTLPETGVADPVLSRDVLNALAALPRGQRVVIVLRYFDDLTEKQTAAALGCSVGTVKSQAARALAALRISPHLEDS